MSGRFQVLRAEVLHFFATSSIQGLQNVSDSRRAVFVRTVWFGIVVASFVCAGICIKESVEGRLE
jgi:hypothetical protein